MMMLIWMKDISAALRATESGMLIRLYDWLTSPVNINESGKGKIDLVSFRPENKALQKNF